MKIIQNGKLLKEISSKSRTKNICQIGQGDCKTYMENQKLKITKLLLRKQEHWLALKNIGIYFYRYDN